MHPYVHYKRTPRVLRCGYLRIGRNFFWDAHHLQVEVEVKNFPNICSSQHQVFQKSTSSWSQEFSKHMFKSTSSFPKVNIKLKSRIFQTYVQVEHQRVEGLPNINPFVPFLQFSDWVHTRSWPFLLSNLFHVRWSTTRFSGKFIRYRCIDIFVRRTGFQNWAYPSLVKTHWCLLRSNTSSSSTLAYVTTTPEYSTGTRLRKRFSPLHTHILHYSEKIPQFSRIWLTLEFIPFMLYNVSVFISGHVN